MGWDLSDHQPDVAPKLGALDPVFRIPSRHPESDLYHQRGGVVEYELAESDQDAGIVSQSGSRLQAALPSLGTHREKVDHAGGQLEKRLATFRNSARRSRSES